MSAAESTAAVGAAAYTVGRQIVFGAGRYDPHSNDGRRLLAHELAHTVQQEPAYQCEAALEVAEGRREEVEATAAALAAVSRRPLPRLTPSASASLARQKLSPDEPLTVQRDYTPDWSLFLKPMSAPAVKEKCKEFPGGSTDCEVSESTGIPTGKVTTRVDETNPCTKPCVEKHEAVHVKQMAKLCAALHDCYVQADKGKRPATDCFKMAIASGAKNECEAYAVSVPCVEQRLKSAPECKSTANQRYGAEKLESEKCFRDHFCAGT